MCAVQRGRRTGPRSQPEDRGNVRYSNLPSSSSPCLLYSPYSLHPFFLFSLSSLITPSLPPFIPLSLTPSSIPPRPPHPHPPSFNPPSFPSPPRPLPPPLPPSLPRHCSLSVPPPPSLSPPPSSLPTPPCCPPSSLHTSLPHSITPSLHPSLPPSFLHPSLDVGREVGTCARSREVGAARSRRSAQPKVATGPR